MTKILRISAISLAALLAVALMLARPIAELDGSAHIMLGGIILALCIWIFKPFRLTYAVGGLVLALAGLLVELPPTVIFSGFTQTALWTLIPAFFFGYTLQKTGLGRRIAMAVIKICRPPTNAFENREGEAGNRGLQRVFRRSLNGLLKCVRDTYLSLILAWIPIGVVLSILTPATTVRIAIMLPIAVQCCELFGLKKGSKGNSLVLLTAFAMALIPGSGWLTGVIWGPFIQGQLANAGVYITFGDWLDVLLVPVIIATVFLVVGGFLLLKPEEKLSADAINAVKKLPPEKMTKNEIISAVILLLVFALSLTHSFHGLSTAIICIAAMICFFVFGVLETKDFNAAANWDLVIFIAMAFSLGPIFSATGISDWLSGIVVPAIAPIAGNPWVFVIIVATFFFLWSLVDVAMFLPTISIAAPILPAIQEMYGINPIVWVAIFILAGNAFFMAYQNMWAVMSRSIAGERAWTTKHQSIYGLIYFAGCLVALLVAIPMWMNAGLFG
ncbi:MAG: SLC13 family permease [Defluviitaleaceae bacterium]|nr:SLC13 family permease [Defluviitaleaceae bacterium]